MSRPFSSEPREAEVATDGCVVAREADLSGVRRRVRAELKEYGMSPSASFDCLVALTEACTNALVHGRSTGPGGDQAHVMWAIDSHAARFYVRDFSNRRWAIAVHPSGGVPPGDDPDIKERVGGLGIELMRRLMDEVDISINPHGTTVRLVKLFGRAIS
ncbi:MAG: ATP-binding protein [Actinomycetota bacterium]